MWRGRETAGIQREEWDLDILINVPKIIGNGFFFLIWEIQILGKTEVNDVC